MLIKLSLSFVGIVSLVCNSLIAQVQSGDLVAMLGSSTTGQLMYSRYVAEYLLMCQPAEAVESVQFGWGGEFAGALLHRLDHDVGAFEPDVVTLLYGMNDGRYLPVSDERLASYRESMSAVVRRLKAAGTREIYLATPGVVDPGSFSKSSVSAEDYNETLRAIGREARLIAEAEGIHCVEVNHQMAIGMAAAKDLFGEGYEIAPDGIHPRKGGHLLIAYAFLEGMGFDGEIGRITVNYNEQQVECDAAQQVLSFEEGVLEMQSTRYPFMPEYDGTNQDAQTMAELIDFNQNMNRYLLVIKGAPVRVRVRWGAHSHIYSAAELSVGVNLAADFETTPFRDAYMAVSQAIAEQQQYERTAVRHLLHSVPTWSREFSETDPGLADHLRGLILDKSAALRATAVSKVQPVRHKLHFEAVN